MKETQPITKKRISMRVFAVAAMALAAVPAFATGGDPGLDLTPMIGSAKDDIVAFFTTTGGALIGVVLTVGLFFLVVKMIRRVLKGGG